MMFQFKIVIVCFFLFLTACQEKNRTTTSSVDIEEVNAIDKLSALKTPDEYYGQLFKDIQLSQVFPDGKTFVDCTPKVQPSEINSAYRKVKDAEGFDLKEFVEMYFDIPSLVSSDFKSDPERSASQHINALWHILIQASTIG